MIGLVACAGMAVLNKASSATGANTSQRNLLTQVGGQLRRSRSAQAVSDVKKTNPIRLFFIGDRRCKLRL